MVIVVPAPLPYVAVLIITRRPPFTRQRELFWFCRVHNLYFGGYLQVIWQSAFKENREKLLIDHSGASSPPIGRGARIYLEVSVHASA